MVTVLCGKLVVASAAP
ncbi:hypothetical protein L4F36_17695 [Vibrio paracholerae]|nr:MULTISPECIES: hypothetical protein [Vibrio]MCO7021260.1 hypothetical protein [Vibrio paracholerae]MCO7031080.1 hypothetical protein [Vibrio paracholerae]MCO7068663.1 hypothetical protein [Vibrio paracholerae]MCO7068744.1 hypothetical protein [Vibrio paracholerae]MCO7068746.1 hypothetical protein [Vibrio paracholerae]